MAAVELHIQTLGRFRVLREAEPIPDRAWGTHRAKILFKLLLTHHGQPLLKDQIMEWLWPDATLKAASQALYTAVSDLRRALEPDLPRRAGSAFILSTDDGYQFNPDSPHILDKMLFGQQVTAARHHAQHNAPEAAAQAYAQAEALYAGDYLPDDLYAEWSIGERDRLRSLMLASLAEAAAIQAGLGRYRQAVANCRRALDLDCCQEETYRALMRYHYAAGDQAQALRAYAECEAVLQRELEVAPMAATQTLADQIKARQVAGVDDRVAPPVAPRAPKRYSLSQMPFIGRAAEQVQIQRLQAAAAAGQGGLLLVVGEAGVGKSTLVSHVLDGEGGAILGRGDAHELTQGLPYHPLADVIYHAWGEGWLPPAPQFWLPQIARLVPEVEPVEAAAATAQPPDEDKARLFDALRGCFLSLSGSNTNPGCVIVLEDLQWADEETLEFLAYLAPHLGRSPVLIVVTCRPDDRLKPLLARAGRDPWMHALRLRPLAEVETVELVIRLAAEAAAMDAFGRRLYKATGGNPLFAAGVLARLFETGQLWSDAQGHWQGVAQLLAAPVLPVPDEVDELVVRRMQGLSPTARRLLSIVAVADGADAALLQSVSDDFEAGLTGEALLDALDELLESDLLGTTPEGEFQFHNDALREAAYRRLNVARCQRLHAAVGAALERQTSGRHPGEEEYSAMAEHFWRGQVWDKAVDYRLQAGDAATQLSAYAEARQHYEAVLEALSHLAKTDDTRRRRVDVIVKYLNVSHSAIDPEHNLTRLAEAERLVRELPGSAGPAMSPEDRLRLAWVHHWMGQCYALRNQAREAVRNLQSAEVVAREVGDIELLATSSTVLGRVLVRQGHFIRAQTLLTQVVASLERVVNWQQWVYNLSFLGIALAAQGQIAAAMAAGERALARAQAAENSTAILSSHLALAIIHFMTGDIQRMLAESRTGLTAAEQSGDRLFGYIGLGLLGWAASRLGNDEAAQELIARSQTANQELGGQLLLSDWFAAAAAEIALTAGHPEESLTLAEQAVAQAQSVDGLFAQGLAHRVWAAALWQREGSIIMKGEGEIIRPSAWQPFDYVQGSLRSGQALSPDSLKAAEAHLRASLQAFESGGAWLEAARTHGVWGCLCRNHNDDAAARHHFEQAAARFETFGLDNELAQIRRWQAESGASYDP